TARRRPLLARRRRRRDAARLRALARPSRRPPAPRRSLLHDERRHQRRSRRHVIRARGLGKTFGVKRVLRNVDLDLPRGGFGLVTGPNGSGKTTLLRICAGLAVPSEGDLEVEAERARVGYLGHEPLVYRELSALENLDLYGRLYR